MPSFEENLKAVFSESQYNLCMQNRKTDQVYQQLEREYNQLFDRIRKLLGKKHRKLMLKLEAVGNHKGAIDDDLIYLQGMIDCAKLLRIIKMV